MKTRKLDAQKRARAGRLKVLALALALVAASPLVSAQKIPASSRPRYGGAATIVWTEPMAVANPPQSSLPSERAFSSLIFEPLLQWTGKGPRALLAESWAANEDSTEWTIRLKRGVRFHNGKVLTGDDVVYSIRRVLDSTSPCSCGWLLQKLLAVTTVDGAVVFSFSEPQPDLPGLLSCPGLAILPFSASKYEPDSGPLVGLTVGTGPFRAEWAAPPTRFELKADRDHHLGRPFLDAVSWTFAPFDEGLVEFQAGSCVLLAGIPSPLAGGLTSLPAGTKRLVGESSYLIYLGCNPTRAVLRTPKSRRTVLGAVDRSSILTSIVGKGGRIAHGLVESGEAHSYWDAAPGLHEGSGAGGDRNPDLPGNSQPGPNSAGVGSREITLLVPSWHSLIEEIGERIQVDLMEAGYSVKLRKAGREELRAKLASGDFDLFVGLWAPDPWSDRREWLINDFRVSQVAPVPALASAVPSVDRLPAGGLEEALALESLLLPLFDMDLVVYLRDSLVSVETAGAIPDLGWSWLRAGPR
jgi:ABC-type transport system substrate-binding protein